MPCRRLAPPALVLLATVLPAAGSVAQNNIRFTVPLEWNLANVQEDKTVSLLEFVRRGDTIVAWQELLWIVQAKRAREQKSPRDTYDRVRAAREASCPEQTDWQVIQEDSKSLLYESHTRGQCGVHPPQRELARILHGGGSWWQAGYVTRGELTDEGRTTWIAWLNSVALVR